MNPNLGDIFRTALLIRRVEERIAELYPTDCIQSPVHLSLGQEHHIAALCAALDREDAIFSSYRCHAAYLAKGGPLPQFFAELFGKSGGMSGGKAGSMHLTAPEQKMLGSSGIVAAVIPHAVGYAYGFRLSKKPQICVSLSGDGSLEEGAFWESLNFAKLRRAPVLFVVEQNDWAVNTRRAERQAFSLEALAKVFSFPFFSVSDSFAMEAIYDKVKELRTQVLENGPAILEINTCRYAEHVGVHASQDAQSIKEVSEGKARDPLLLNHEWRNKYLPSIEQEIEAAVRFAQNSPWPEPGDLLKDVIS